MNSSNQSLSNNSSFNDKVTIEWAPFETASHVTDQQLIQYADNLEEQFLKTQQGYLRRELLKRGPNKWVDMVYWDSPENARLATKTAHESQVCLEYFSLMVGVEEAEAGILHLYQVKQWN